MPLTPDQIAEIEALRAAPQPTLRAVSPGMEAHLYVAHPVLDHGFVRVIDYMGDDAAIVQAARVSYGAGTKHVSNDEGLIRYLMRHWHSSPFEMCEIKLHVKLPVFVARQWIRHRMANVNEYSARYSILDREFYIPAPEHLAAQSVKNNQGRGEVLQGAEAARVLEILKTDAGRAFDDYEAMLSQEDQQGLARELARMNLPMNTYTQWYWKTDLHNLFHFLRLRADAHAQYEIRVYAEMIAQMVKDWVPLAHAAFEDYRLGGVNLSAKAVTVLKRRLAGQAVGQEDSGMSKGEWREFVEIWGPMEPDPSDPLVQLSRNPARDRNTAALRKMIDDGTFEMFWKMRAYIEHEDNLVNQKTTWFLTLNSFLFATVGLLASVDVEKSILTERQVLMLFYVFGAIGILFSLVTLTSVQAAYSAVKAVKQLWAHKYEPRAQDYGGNSDRPGDLFESQRYDPDSIFPYIKGGGPYRRNARRSRNVAYGLHWTVAVSWIAIMTVVSI